MVKKKGCGKSCGKGCMIVFMQIMMFLPSSILVQLQYAFHIFPDGVLRFVVPAVMGFLPSILVGSGIYKYTMSRYRVLAPESPYEYKKMATLTLTRDEMKQVGGIPYL